MVDRIYHLMHSHLHGVVNFGCPQYVTVDELANAVARVSGKRTTIKHVPGPVGVQSRNFSNQRMYSLGWEPKVFLEDGIRFTYPWAEAQVMAARGKRAG